MAALIAAVPVELVTVVWPVLDDGGLEGVGSEGTLMKNEEMSRPAGDVGSGMMLSARRTERECKSDLNVSSEVLCWCGGLERS